jgi:hypothetical protein
MAITIYHNPKCGTSRTVLEALQGGGHAPEVVEYLKVGWTEAQLQDLFERMSAKPRDLLRVKGTPAEELGPDAAGRRRRRDPAGDGAAPDPGRAPDRGHPEGRLPLSARESARRGAGAVAPV